MKSAEVFAPEFKTSPYWWERSPLIAGESVATPAQCDVAIVGAGYTGLHAAIQTARSGLSTVVFDAESAGYGCSTRNGGQISTSIKPSWSTLVARYGETVARNFLQHGEASLKYVEQFVHEHDIECDFTVSGRFHGAHSKRAWQRLQASMSTNDGGFDNGAWLVSPQQMAQELGTDCYHGGIVYPHHASVDPGRYYTGILRIAKASGVEIVSHCPIQGIERRNSGFELKTASGTTIRAREVFVATNGYTGSLTPWLQRRVIPIGSYVIATEEIDPALMDQIMPTMRVLSDTRKLVYYYRPSPDRKRIIFGGRVSLSETDARVSGVKLRDELVRLFPSLRDVKITHSWVGFVAYTFDSLMHCGEQQGVHYAMGYCGSGVGMAGYLGMRSGQQIATKLGARASVESLQSFEQIPFTTRPLYSGKPWFLAPSIMTYRVIDRMFS